MHTVDQLSYPHQKLFTYAIYPIVLLGLGAFTLFVVGILGGLQLRGTFHSALFAAFSQQAVDGCLLGGGATLFLDLVVLSILYIKGKQTLENEGLRIENRHLTIELLTEKLRIQEIAQGIKEIKKELNSENETNNEKPVENGPMQATNAQETITIKMNDLTQSVQRKALIKLSDKFRAMFGSTFTEESSNTLTLNNPPLFELDCKTTQEFLLYLKNNKIDLNADNVLPFLALAREHCIDFLEIECVEYLYKGLKISNISAVLQYALDLQANNLIWACLTFASQTCHQPDLLKILESPLSKEVKTILNLAVKCNENCIRLEIEFFANGIRRAIILSFRESFNPKAFKVIKKLQSQVSITFLRIGEKFLSTSDPEGLSALISKNLHELAFLKIKVFILHVKLPLISLPPLWMEQLIVLDLVETNITNLDMPQLMSLDCFYCKDLLSIHAPRLQTAKILGCNKIESIQIPYKCAINDEIPPRLIKRLNNLS